MSRDVIVVIGYIIVVALLCITWNKFMMKRYESGNSQRSLVHGAILRCSQNIDQIDDLELAGSELDKNNDYEFIEAARKILVSEDTRIKLND